MKLHLVTTECDHWNFRALTHVRETTPWLEWNKYRKIVCTECGEWLFTEKFSALDKARYQAPYTQSRRRSSQVGCD